MVTTIKLEILIWCARCILVRMVTRAFQMSRDVLLFFDGTWRAEERGKRHGIVGRMEKWGWGSGWSGAAQGALGRAGRARNIARASKNRFGGKYIFQFWEDFRKKLRYKKCHFGILRYKKCHLGFGLLGSGRLWISLVRLLDV